jgi:high-affinity nickel-transport protein
MESLPADWGAMLALVFMLGLRHGIDADHIASIDALTRLRAGRRARGAAWCGALFALGHGTVVLVIVATLSAATSHWTPPAWLAPLGAWISIALLTVLGLANIRAVLQAGPGQIVRPAGLRGRVFARLLGAQAAGHRAAPTAVGALFAASFDTVSLAALFAVSGSAWGRQGGALALGAVFACGMLVTDGVNGWWVARLISRADAYAATASRVTGWLVGAVSLLAAGLGFARLASPTALEGAEFVSAWLGVAALAIAATALAAALVAARYRAAAPTQVRRQGGS